MCGFEASEKGGEGVAKRGGKRVEKAKKWGLKLLVRRPTQQLKRKSPSEKQEIWKSSERGGGGRRNLRGRK